MKEFTIEQKAKAYDEVIKRGLDYISQTPERTKWISIEDWNCMSHSQYAWNFFVVELVNKIGYMGKHIVCVMDRDENFHVDCDYGKIINMTKVAAILPIEPYDKSCT